MTAARLRTLRAAVVEPNLTFTTRRYRAWRYLDAAAKAPRASQWWARVLDTGRYSEAEQVLFREALSDAARTGGGL